MSSPALTSPETLRHFLPAQEYDLDATLNSGQAFRWQHGPEGWASVVDGRWVQLRKVEGGIEARTAVPQSDWHWLKGYLQTEVDLAAILETFPADEPMQRAIQACRGLRLLRQPPWETLASFILSSTKQIVQIRQIVSQLAERFGNAVVVEPGEPTAWSFPSAMRIAEISEDDLRACKAGFRAPYLLADARAVASGKLNLDALPQLPYAQAGAELRQLPGVGPKIAECVLLFAGGFPEAFPVDVWVAKALRELYFPRRRPSAARLQHFIATHFGPHRGYAQQYLFHYMRVVQKRGHLANVASQISPCIRQ